jgi:hypothetical protein
VSGGFPGCSHPVAYRKWDIQQGRLFREGQAQEKGDETDGLKGMVL